MLYSHIIVGLSKYSLCERETEAGTCHAISVSIKQTDDSGWRWNDLTD